MKKVLAAGAVFLIAAVAYNTASPYLALSGLKDAINSGDTAELEDRVDFEALRESLKAELNATVMAEAASGLQDNPFGSLAIGLATKLVDGIVDSTVTPSGLARLATGATPAPPDTPSERPTEKSENTRELFPDARVERDTFSRFSVWVPSDQGESRFVFRRTGLTWRLTGIELPDST